MKGVSIARCLSPSSTLALSWRPSTPYSIIDFGP